MKNINPKNNGEEPFWFYVMMEITVVVIIISVSIILIIDHFMPKEISPEEKCKIECEKFEMDYYKVDWHLNDLKICWCLNGDGKPRSIGGV